MESILFVGPIADTGGPAIKNKILVKQIQKKSNLVVWNTYDKSLRARMGSIIKILFSKQKYIIVAVSRKGRNLLYPFLLLKNLVCKTHFCCIAIGGKVEDSFNNILSERALKKADLITVETKGIKNNLEIKYALNNVYWMPNYKEFRVPLDDCISEKYNTKTTRFLFLSSMRDVKGVKTLIEAFNIVKKSGYDIQLDFYGPIKKDLSQEYLKEIENTSGMNYCGEVKNENVLDVMSKYDVFVFPTEYSGEGFPAVLVEALVVGLPVIASNMNYNGEIIKESINGFLFSIGSEIELADKMAYCCSHKEKLKTISQDNVSESRQYDSSIVIEEYCNTLRKKGWPI